MFKTIVKFFFIAPFLFVSCTKNKGSHHEPPGFTIEASKWSSYPNIYLTGDTVRFKNESNSGDNFQWHFGDGATATDYNAKHAYSLPGKYTVWLTTYSGNKAVDSTSETLQVVALPKYIKREEQYSSHPLWIGTYGDKFYLAGWQAGIDNIYNYKEWFITQYDSLWRVQWTKTFLPTDGTLLRMSVTTNGDLLIPQVKVVNNVWTSKLSRMDANGSIKWSWNTSDSVSINVAMEDKNGNIIMMGEKLYPDPLQTAYSNGIAIKLDASGKETWRYAFPGQHTLENTSKIVSLSDGYIIAGNKSGPCTLTCDSASIVKLSLDGKLLWNTIIPWSAGSTTAWDVFAVLDQSNNVQVVSSRSTSYYTFDLNGKLLGWRLFPTSIMPSDALINKNGLLLILGDLPVSNTRQTRLIGFDANGSGWTHDVYKTITDQRYVQNPRETWGMSMALTNDNIALVASRFTYFPSAGSSVQNSAIVITTVNRFGNLY